MVHANLYSEVDVWNRNGRTGNIVLNGRGHKFSRRSSQFITLLQVCLHNLISNLPYFLSSKPSSIARRALDLVIGFQGGGEDVIDCKMHPLSLSSSLAKQPFLSHSLPQKILLGLCIPSWIRPSGFHFFGFRNSNFFFYKARSSNLYPTPSLEDQVSVCMSFSDRVAQLYPR
jgi:hypothetical protein